MSYDPFQIGGEHRQHKKALWGVRGKKSLIDVAPTTTETIVSQQAPIQQYTLKVPLVVAAFVFCLVIGRLFFLQVLHGAEYRAEAEGNRTHLEIKKALRGIVYDRNGVPLVKNVPNFTIVVNARLFSEKGSEHREKVIRTISEQTTTEESVVRAAVESSLQSGQAKIVIEHIEYTNAIKYMVTLRHMQGVDVETFYSREYTASEAFSHLLGYTGKLNDAEYQELRASGYQLNDDIGKSGIEKQYERTLKGIDGVTEREVDNSGNQKTVLADTPPQKGTNVILSIDSAIQEQLFNSIKEVVESRGLSGGSAVAIDPRNGEVRALVSYPTYNNNHFAKGMSSEEYQSLVDDERNPLFNRSIAGEYPSGSTFKPVVAAAALEEGLITPYTTVLSTGGIRIDQFFFPDWKAGGHGVTNVIKALSESVNTFFYLVGGGDNETTTGLGVERITAYAKKFGLGNKTDIDLNGERSGFLPSKGWKEEFKNEPWYIGDTYHLAIGQGDILVTPLQMANMISTIANGGTLYQPTIVHQLTDNAGTVLQELSGHIRMEQVVSNNSMRVVQEGLREAVLSGSARSLQSLPVTSAGKTGTAQFGGDEKTHSWFIAYAPYEEPEIAITVMIEGAGGGNDAAVPIARQALQTYFSSKSE